MNKQTAKKNAEYLMEAFGYIDAYKVADLNIRMFLDDADKEAYWKDVKDIINGMHNDNY